MRFRPTYVQHTFVMLRIRQKGLRQHLWAFHFASQSFADEGVIFVKAALLLGLLSARVLQKFTGILKL